MNHNGQTWTVTDSMDKKELQQIEMSRFRTDAMNKYVFRLKMDGVKIGTVMTPGEWTMGRDK